MRRVFRKIVKTNKETDYGAPMTETVVTNELASDDLVITSEIMESSLHAPVIDIDGYPIYIVPSATPGHYHLYIDKPIPKHKFMALLAVMADCGLVEQGYADASNAQGYSAVRAPWSKKVLDEKPPPF